MKVIDVGTENERIVTRCRIEGTFRGISFVYEDPEDSEGSQYIWTRDNDPSKYWWSEGNFACDCNRRRFLPENLQNQKDEECGDEIIIKIIIPIEGDNLPVLELDEDDFTLN
ncbi:MAG: hypothetical protein KF744_09125 [Taibaiella sp.]|nr:hypothetical protein [Taibaiella sp.]